MPARPPIRLAPGDEQLPAPRAKARRHRPPHRRDRQEPQQHEMDQRQQQPLRPRHRYLPRESARQPDRMTLHEPGHARHRVRRQPHIRVHEHHQLVPRQPGQHVAGVLLARPARRQRRRRRHAQPRIGDPAQDSRRAVRARIIQHDQFELHPLAGQHAGASLADIRLLVARRDQHRHRRAARSRAAAGAAGPG